MQRGRGQCRGHAHNSAVISLFYFKVSLGFFLFAPSVWQHTNGEQQPRHRGICNFLTVNVIKNLLTDQKLLTVS